MVACTRKASTGSRGPSAIVRSRARLATTSTSHVSHSTCCCRSGVLSTGTRRVCIRSSPETSRRLARLSRSLQRWRPFATVFGRPARLHGRLGLLVAACARPTRPLGWLLGGGVLSSPLSRTLLGFSGVGILSPSPLSILLGYSDGRTLSPPPMRVTSVGLLGCGVFPLTPLRTTFGLPGGGILLPTPVRVTLGLLGGRILSPTPRHLDLRVSLATASTPLAPPFRWRGPPPSHVLLGLLGGGVFSPLPLHIPLGLLSGGILLQPLFG